jgi:hypothetical protein
MKLTKSQLKQLIKEELVQLVQLKEDDGGRQEAAQWIGNWAEEKKACLAGSDEETAQIKRSTGAIGLDPAFLQKIWKLSGDLNDLYSRLAQAAAQRAQ